MSELVNEEDSDEENDSLDTASRSVDSGEFQKISDSETESKIDVEEHDIGSDIINISSPDIVEIDSSTNTSDSGMLFYIFNRQHVSIPFILKA